jgi:hypothetical protein
MYQSSFAVMPVPLAQGEEEYVEDGLLIHERSCCTAPRGRLGEFGLPAACIRLESAGLATDS